MIATILAVSLLAQVSVATQDLSDWTRVQQLRKNQRIRVDATVGQRTTGRLALVKDQSVFVVTRHSLARLERRDIRQVSAERGRSSKLSKAVVAVGGSLVLVNAITRNPEAGPGLAWYVGFPLGLAGVIAMLHERGHMDVIYQQPTPR